MTASILLVDTETDFLESIEFFLMKEGFTDLTLVSDPRQAMNRFKEKEFDLALLDISMPGMNGLELLERIKREQPYTECLVMTADERVPTIVTAMRLGAHDYLVKPIPPHRMIHAIHRVLEHQRLFRTVRVQKTSEPDESPLAPIVFKDFSTIDRATGHLLREAELHAPSDILILITGETGVGKEVMARSIHKASTRAARPFVAVNMLSLSSGLFESEFFGHAKGAFTGADYEKEGFLSRAKGGTLFLDEIGDLPLDIQGKLLRLLQEGEYVKVGRNHPVRADVRFVAATNRNLKKAVKDGSFRKDLFYRLQFAHLHIPPLRKRMEDVPYLAARFLKETQPAGKTFSEAALSRLQEYDFPGNIRELRGLVEAAANLAQGGDILPEHLRLPKSTQSVPSAASGAAKQPGTILPLAVVERHHILQVYEALERNKTATAKALKIGLRTLHRKLDRYGVS